MWHKNLIQRHSSKTSGKYWVWREIHKFNRRRINHATALTPLPGLPNFFLLLWFPAPLSCRPALLAAVVRLSPLPRGGSQKSTINCWIDQVHFSSFTILVSMIVITDKERGDWKTADGPTRRRLKKSPAAFSRHLPWHYNTSIDIRPSALKY